MKLNILKDEDGYMELEFGGESHTLLNILQSSLLEDPNVEMAGYNKPHPLMDRSRLFIKMKKGKKTQDALKKAADNAEKKMKGFLEEFRVSLAEFKK